jgi:site-specific recombinase XerD
MIETISAWQSVKLRHESAPLLKEREHYLTHLLQEGLDRSVVRSTAAYLIHIVRIMNMTSLRPVRQEEINIAGKVWAAYKEPHRKKKQSKGSPITFIQIARKWLRFHHQLETPPSNLFQPLIAEYVEAMRSARRLAPDTVFAYSSKALNFLKWFGERHANLELVSLLDVDDFLSSKRAAGWSVRSIASHCQALRGFFRYAAIRGWCASGLASGIHSPRIPKYDGRPKAPTWAEVGRLLESASGSAPNDFRDRAILLLFAIYGLRSSEVAGLRLKHFDWRNETFSVQRAKRGGIQQFPIQYEVGEAIIEYLKKSRPHCSSCYVFTASRRPHGPIRPGQMWQVVGRRMRQLGIELEHIGPHSLRHACATRLLRKGASLQEIADFLGHHSLDSVSIYAKYDTRSLRQVADFSLAGVL